jgi:hypothetical protein
MAILKQPTASSSIFELRDELPPRGTFVAKCIDIRDVFGVERKKYQSEEMEKVDLTGFLFGFRTKDGRPFRIATRAFRISGSEKSGLFNFLKSWLGQAPTYGRDYMEHKGRTALITVDHQPSRSKPGAVYAVIASISPLPEGYTQQPAAPQQPPAPAPAPKTEPAPVDDAGDEIPF